MLIDISIPKEEIENVKKVLFGNQKQAPQTNKAVVYVVATFFEKWKTGCLKSQQEFINAVKEYLNKIIAGTERCSDIVVALIVGVDSLIVLYDKNEQRVVCGNYISDDSPKYKFSVNYLAEPAGGATNATTSYEASAENDDGVQRASRGEDDYAIDEDIITRINKIISDGLSEESRYDMAFAKVAVLLDILKEDLYNIYPDSEPWDTEFFLKVLPDLAPKAATKDFLDAEKAWVVLETMKRSKVKTVGNDVKQTNQNEREELRRNASLVDAMTSIKEYRNSNPRPTDEQRYGYASVGCTEVIKYVQDVLMDKYPGTGGIGSVDTYIHKLAPYATGQEVAGFNEAEKAWIVLEKIYYGEFTL